MLFSLGKKKPDPEEERRAVERLEARLQRLEKKARANGPAFLRDDAGRQAARRKTRKVGEITLPGGQVVACLVTDISDGGMKIFLYEEAILNETFRLVVPTLGFDQDVTLAWQEGKDAGLYWDAPETA